MLVLHCGVTQVQPCRVTRWWSPMCLLYKWLLTLLALSR
jgi:hypothetical protein